MKNRREAYTITVQAGEPGWIAKAVVADERRPGPAAEV